MRLSSKRIAAVVLVAGTLFALLAGGALAAPPWSDAPNSYWMNNYGVTDTEVAMVADGYEDNTFKPGLAVNRGQFAKMAVSGLDLAPVDSAVPTFLDVAKGSTFYTFVEGAYAEGLVTGYPVTGGLEYRPLSNIQRQQANSILGRFLSDAEIAASGVIHGTGGLTYPSLALWYAAQGAFYLNGFDDGGSVAGVHRPATAYLVYHGIVQGSNDKLNPLATLTRSQAAVMILRVAEEAADITTAPPAPTNLSVTPPSPDKDTTPIVTGQTIPGGIIHIYDAVNGAAVLDLFAGVSDAVAPRADASGTFTANLPMLTDGNHVFTAKVKNANGLVSAFSTSSAAYVLDTIAPTGTVTAPVVGAGQVDAAVKTAKPDFTVTATDERSGIEDVEFLYATAAAPTVWIPISVDDTVPYAATWGAISLVDGQYLFRAVVSDNAGNTTTPPSVPVTVDTAVPSAQIAAVTLVPQPAGGGVIFYSEERKPLFGAIGADQLGTGAAVGAVASGVAKIEFLYAPISPTPDDWTDFALISDESASSGFAAYDAAGIPAAGMNDGHYLFAVRATDRAGNVSLLMSGSPASYVAGVTRQVVIDNLAPVVTITAPAAGALVPDAMNYTITWTISDLTMSSTDNVKIEYTLDGSVQTPSWVQIVASTPNDGSYDWIVPDIPADNASFKIMITATDKAGALVGDVAGHTTAQPSGQFTVYVAPLGVTALTASDPDTTAASGVDGRDFTAGWTLSATPLAYAASQSVYILPDGVALDIDGIPGSTAHTPVGPPLGDTITSWTGTNALTQDSQTPRVNLVAGNYKIWIVVTDLVGRTAAVSSTAFPVTGEL